MLENIKENQIYKSLINGQEFIINKLFNYNGKEYVQVSPLKDKETKIEVELKSFKRYNLKLVEE